MADRPAQTEEIEITPKMVQAATQLLWEAGRMDYQADGPDHLLVYDILCAALSQAGYTTKIGRHAAKGRGS